MSDYIQQIAHDFEPANHLNDEYKEVAQNNNSFNSAMAALDNPFAAPELVIDLYLIEYILEEISALSTQLRGSIAENDIRITDGRWSREQRNDYNILFSFVGQSLEFLLKKSVFKYILAEDAKTSEVKNMVFGLKGYWGISVSECLDYLYNAEIIDDGLKGNIKQAWEYRCEAVHNLRGSFFSRPSVDEVEVQIGHAERAIVRLIEITFEIKLEST